MRGAGEMVRGFVCQGAARRWKAASFWTTLHREGFSRLGIEVAGGETPLDGENLRLLGRAARHHMGAARVETAARRRVQGARDLAGQDDLLPLLVGVGGERR